MAHNELLDESFDKEFCGNYELSIQACLNGFSFAIKDAIRNTFVALVDKPLPTITNDEDDWQAALQNLFNTYTWLRSSFRKVVFTFKQAPYTLVPLSLFDETNAKQVLSLTNSVPKLYEIRYHEFAITQPKSMAIFALPSMLASAWLAVHHNTQFVAPIAQFNPATFVSIGSNYLLVDAEKYSFSVAHLNNGNLHAVNTFAYQTAADFAYYLLGFCNTLGLEPQKLGVKLLGRPQTDVAPLLQQYFDHVSTDIVFTSTLFSYRLMKYRANYFGLFNQNSQCE